MKPHQIMQMLMKAHHDAAVSALWDMTSGPGLKPGGIVPELKPWVPAGEAPSEPVHLDGHFVAVKIHRTWWDRHGWLCLRAGCVLPKAPIHIDQVGSVNLN